MLIPLIIIWTCVAVNVWLTYKNLKATIRAERRRAALLEQTAMLKTLWIHRSVGNIDAALLTIERFHEHDEALLREFPELKPK